MADFGLTPQGFKRKTYPDILESMKARARAFFGEDVNLSDKSPLGLFIQSITWEYARLWEEAEKVYYSGYIDSAEGVSLDGVAKYAAATRKGPQYATGYILAIGDEGTEVTPAFIAGTKNKVYFKPDATYTLEAEPTRVNIICLDTGKEGNVPAETITEIITPLAGLESITNPEPTTDGQDTEVDPEFRDRYYRSLAAGGSSTSAAVEAALLEIPTVKDVKVEENDTMEIVNGLPPKCIAPYVFGGDDAEVAQTILQAKAGGIQSYGTTQIEAIDTRGYRHLVGFTRPASKDIYVKVTITKNVQYPADGDTQVRTAIIKYIGGRGIDGAEYKGLGLGQDVVLNKIIMAINIYGVDDLVIELSTDGIEYNATNIPISKMEIANTDFEKVVVL